MTMQKARNNGQAAGDGRKEKDSVDEVAEAPVPAAAASCEGKSESGSAAKSASGNRPNDRYRSASAALEMVVSRRLAEQAIERFFSDPPAELAALIGSPKIAERIVPPGRALVRAQGADDNAATSENGMRNAGIEANGDEAQADDLQKDRVFDPDHVGEERTQVRDRNSPGHG
jgi:hypothetical protein